MQYRLPDLGEGVHEAEIVQWMVRPGDTVRREQPLAEVMTDKAVVELPSPFEGQVQQLLAGPGDTVKIDAPLIQYSALADSDQTPAQESGQQEQRENEAAPSPQAPSPQAPSPQAPSPQAQSPERPVPQHDPAAEPNGNGVPAAPEPPCPVEPPLDMRRAAAPSQVAAPAVRRMARCLDIDLQEVSGSGPDGRVLIEDLADRVRSAAMRDLVPNIEPRPGSRIPLRGIRRKTAERMVLSKRLIPHYSYVDECDVTKLVRVRAALREAMAPAGVRLTFMPFFVQAVCGALKSSPLVNSSLDEARNEIVLHDRCHIGIAVATARGLMVPVLRDADRMDLEQIALEIERLASQARDGRLRHEDLVGSTFTITSIGGIGGLISTPIINHPEVGIMGVGRIGKRPVCDEQGAIRAADMVYLSFSFDHRVVDGAVGAEFGNSVIRNLQDAGLKLDGHAGPKRADNEAG